MVKHDKNLSKGFIDSIQDGVIWLRDAALPVGSSILFTNGTKGLVLSVSETRSAALALGPWRDLSVNGTFTLDSSPFSLGVSNELLGRVINPLGEVLDGKPQIHYTKTLPYEREALGIIEREPIDTPLSTGVLAVDAMIPIGRGQRQLFLGDRGTGKTTLALETLINQKDSNVVGIFVCIGQKRSDVATLTETLVEEGAMGHTVVVSADASEASALWYLAPFAGATIAEYFMEQGRDVVIVYDDLTKHAWAYREMSLLMGRPAGREAYPGDIFYLHSRLLERATKRAKKLGGGSITALPIVETQSGDVSAYIPTNVISITDGQIYFETDLFFKGIRPAINPGLSVSRVGGAAQIKATKKLSGKLRLSLSQYWELTGFASFGATNDKVVHKKLERGKRIIELFKQDQHSPYSQEEEVALLFLLDSGYLDTVEATRVKEVKREFLSFMHEHHSKAIKEIEKIKNLTPEVIEALELALKNFKAVFDINI